jgi:UDP-N-acetylmuramoylalanine--D-glutamate ligase
MDASQYFKGKKITVMGLGLLGRGVGDAKFLASQGADLIITDLKNEEQLQSSLQELGSFSNITYRLGGHDLSDFRDRDFILKAAGVPLDSPFVAEARKHGIPIKMSASWFAEVSGIKTVGITGTRGKSTTTMMLFDIMNVARMRVLLGGNVRGVSTLALLPKVSEESIALMELDSWQCQGWGEAKMSPQVAVFTTFFDDHLNYYKGNRASYLEDKAQIFLHQKEGDILVVGEQAAPALEKYKGAISSRLRVANARNFALQIPGEHNMLNAACAYEAALALGVSDDIIRRSLKDFRGVPGRLEFLREYRGVKIYNDTTATTPEATIAALRAVGDVQRKNVVLIMGGADKGLKEDSLIQEINRYCKSVIALEGTGTLRLQETHRLEDIAQLRGVSNSLESAVRLGLGESDAGDMLLFSPAFASFGMFKNEFDRGDQFREIIEEL